MFYGHRPAAGFLGVASNGLCRRKEFRKRVPDQLHHASFAASALMHETNSSTLVRQRIIGLLANTAALSPEELNDSSSLVEQDPEIFGQSVAALHRRLGLKILGGCCGTDDHHIRALAAQLAIQARQTNPATQKTSKT